MLKRDLNSLQEEQEYMPGIETKGLLSTLEPLALSEGDSLSFEGGAACPHSWPLSFRPCLPARLPLLLTSVPAPQHGFVLASSCGVCHQTDLSSAKP